MTEQEHRKRRELTEQERDEAECGMERRQLIAQGVCIACANNWHDIYLGRLEPHETPLPCDECWPKIRDLEMTGQAGSAPGAD